MLRYHGHSSSPLHSSQVPNICASRRYSELDPIKFLCHHYLTAQPRGVSEPVSEVQHILFFLGQRVGDLVEPVGVYDQVAGGAGESALTGPWGEGWKVEEKDRYKRKIATSPGALSVHSCVWLIDILVIVQI